MNTSIKNVGRELTAAAAVWIGYIVIAETVGHSFEQALTDAAQRLGVPENRLPADVLALINHEHLAGSMVGLPLLLVAPAVLLLAARSARQLAAAPSAPVDWAVRTAGASAVIWWVYLLISLGAYREPGQLPPLTRDLDVLTVPLVTVSSALALVAVIAVAEALRRARIRPRAAVTATILAGLLLVAGVADAIVSGLDEPLPPVAMIPPALVLGLALLRRASARTSASRDLSLAVTPRET